MSRDSKATTALLIFAVLGGEVLGQLGMGRRATSALVVVGLLVGIAAIGSVVQALLRKVLDWPVCASTGACSWVAGWVLWPLWLNHMDERPRNYAVYSEFPAESRPPLCWIVPVDGLYDLWLGATVLGVAIAVAVSAAALIWAAVMAAKEKPQPRTRLAYALLPIAFWVLFGPTIGHAIEWIAD